MHGSHSHRPTTLCSDLTDLRQAIVVSPPCRSTSEDKAVTMLVEEVEKRTRIRWARQDQLPITSPAVVVCTVAGLSALAGTDAKALLSDGDTPFGMCYPGLDPEAAYRVRVVYSQEHPQVRVRLEANEGIEVHPYRLKPRPRAPIECDVPREAARGSKLPLRWYREPGHGGSGTGCDLSEIWLVKDP